MTTKVSHRRFVAGLQCIAIGAVLLISRVAGASPTIDLQNGGHTYSVVAGTPGQTISIYGYGAQPVVSVTLEIQIGTDGGATGGGTDNGPLISAVNVLPSASSIFNSIASGGPHPSTMTADAGPVFDPSWSGQMTESQLWSTGASVNTGTTPVGTGTTAASEQLLATITIDTTGIAARMQPYVLKVIGTVLGDSDFADHTGSIGVIALDGSITVTPEPSSVGILGIAFASLLTRRRRSAL